MVVWAFVYMDKRVLCDALETVFCVAALAITVWRLDTVLQ